MIRMYQPQRICAIQDLAIRHLRLRLRSWGQPQPGVAPLVLLHGWMDVGASYQFVVDAFSHAFAAGRQILAPDWRGFGHSQPAHPVDHYVFADYLGDLDALLDQLLPAGQQIDLVGHSMGANVAMLYAGARPERIRRLINLEGFGLPEIAAAKAPQRMGQWLDELRQLQAGQIALKTYASRAAVAERLRKTNPRLTADKALWLAGEWAAPQPDGQWAILGDASHKVVNPQLFRLEEVLAHYATIRAPLLAVDASHGSFAGRLMGRYTLADYRQRLQAVPNCQTAHVADAGHMLHHDQPEAVARLIEEFVGSGRG